MANIKIPGESIKTKKDAEKFFKDNDATDTGITSDGWLDREARCESIDRKCDSCVYDVLKNNSYGKYFGFKWKPGQWEAVFGKKDD